MPVLGSIPPPFLLPAWTHAQLAVLNACAANSAKLRQFSHQRVLRNTESQGTTSRKPQEIIGGTRSQQEARQTETFLRPREIRYNDGIDRIKERLSRGQGRYIRKATKNFVRAEERLEQHKIVEHQEHKKRIQQYPEHAGKLIRRVKLQAAHLDPNWTDDTGGLALLLPKAERIARGDLSARGIDTNTPEQSLMAELFPEEAAKLQEAKETSEGLQSRAEAPELPLPILDDLQDDSLFVAKSAALPRLVSTAPEYSLRPIPSVLVLENALPNLIEADFRRVSRKGTHIEEWKGVHDPIAIVPARIEQPTDCTGKYYLVFQASMHAKAWRKRLQHIHDIANENNSISLDSQIIPPSGFKLGGEDVGKLLREYSIFSPGIIPKMTLYGDPQANPKIKRELDMISARMQPQAHSLQPGRSVLLWIDGWTLGTLPVIKKMIALDGRMRRGPWGESKNNDMINDFLEENAKAGHEAESDRQEPCLRKWMITLRDQGEARRFIRAWHNRPFPAWEEFKKDDNDEPWPLVKAELLW